MTRAAAQALRPGDFVATKPLDRRPAWRRVGLVVRRDAKAVFVLFPINFPRPVRIPFDDPCALRPITRPRPDEITAYRKAIQ